MSRSSPEAADRGSGSLAADQLAAHPILYLWMSGVFITSLVVANAIGVKVFQLPLSLGGMGEVVVEHTAGMIAFPITFVLTDLLNEYYGKRAARRVVYLSFAMAALAFVYIGLARTLPTLEGIPGTATDAAFENIFGSAALMYVASLIAFLASGLLDIFLFGVFKRLTGQRLIWLRATGSTVVSQLFDSFVVTFVFFVALPVLLAEPTAPLEFVWRTALTGYVLKFVLAVLMTPVIYAGRALIRDRLGLRPLPPE